MPRCRDRWRRYGPIDVEIKATCSDEDVFYQLSYDLLRPRSSTLPIRHGEDYDSGQLREGVSFRVPEGYTGIVELRTTSNQVIDTEIKLNGMEAQCNKDRHCQGPCSVQGPAGIAGSWKITAARTAPSSVTPTSTEGS